MGEQTSMHISQTLKIQATQTWQAYIIYFSRIHQGLPHKWDTQNSDWWRYNALQGNNEIHCVINLSEVNFYTWCEVLCYKNMNYRTKLQLRKLSHVLLEWCDSKLNRCQETPHRWCPVSWCTCPTIRKEWREGTEGRLSIFREGMLDLWWADSHRITWLQQRSRIPLSYLSLLSDEWIWRKAYVSGRPTIFNIYMHTGIQHSDKTL